MKFPVHIVGTYSNTATRKGWNGVDTIPTIVNIDFHCKYVSGELRLSNETIDHGWFTEKEVLELVTHPIYIWRIRNALQKSDVIQCNAYHRINNETNEYVVTDAYEFDRGGDNGDNNK